MKNNILFGEHGIFSGKLVLALVIAATFFSGTALGAVANESTHTWLSTGNVVYNKGEETKTVFNKADLDYLDNKIDTAIAATETAKTEAKGGKINIATELNSWANESYSKNYAPTPSLSVDSNNPPTYGDIITKLQYMKSTPGEGKEFKDSGNNQYYVNAGGGLTTNPTEAADSTKTLKIAAANAGNLSAGTAAWVNGSFIIGTGADNNNYYKAGKTNSSIFDLGTSTSFNVKNLVPSVDYTKLTIDNFAILGISSIGNFSASGSGREGFSGGGACSWNSTCSTSFSLIKSYDSATGVLTCYLREQLNYSLVTSLDANQGAKYNSGSPSRNTSVHVILIVK